MYVYTCMHISVYVYACTYVYILRRDTNPLHPFIATDCLNRVNLYAIAHIRRWVRGLDKVPFPQSESSARE